MQGEVAVVAPLRREGKAVAEGAGDSPEAAPAASTT